MTNTVVPTDLARPYLLDRLLGTGERSGGGGGGVTPAEVAAAVRRDLIYLLQTRAPATGVRQGVEGTVLNFGLPEPVFGRRDLTGGAEEKFESPLAEIKSNIERAIRRFEPRVVPATLRVTIVADGSTADDRDRTPGQVQVRIESDVWANPEKGRLRMTALVDVQTSQVVPPGQVVSPGQVISLGGPGNGGGAGHG